MLIPNWYKYRLSMTSSKSVNYTISNGHLGKLSVYDINGSLVITQNLEGNLNAVIVKQLRSGSYIHK